MAWAAHGLGAENGRAGGGWPGPHGLSRYLYPLSPHPLGLCAGACYVRMSRFDVLPGMAWSAGRLRAENGRAGGAGLAPTGYLVRLLVIAGLETPVPVLRLGLLWWSTSRAGTA